MKIITFVIFTFNEENRIGYVVRNFINYGDVLIMDDGSMDKTREIAEKFGAKVILRPKTGKAFVENQENYDVVLKNTSTDWVYWGFADNMAPKSLLEELVSISHQDKYKYVLVPLYTYLWGETKIPAHKGATPCFFRKNYVDFRENHIHGMGKFLGKENEKIYLKNCPEFALRHFSLYDINKFVLSHLNYAKAEAQYKLDCGNKFSVFKLFRGMVGYFFMYFKSGFRNGKKGLLTGLAYSFFRFMVYFRLFELENDLSVGTIEAEYVKEKERLLVEFSE
jgi:glycosyltransferase involved in cell wall biosynthesis